MMMEKPTLMRGVIEQTAWRTPDGKTFSAPSAANQHAAMLKLRQLLKDSGVGSGGEWDAGMFCDFLIERAASMGPLLETIRTGQVE